MPVKNDLEEFGLVERTRNRNTCCCGAYLLGSDTIMQLVGDVEHSRNGPCLCRSAGYKSLTAAEMLAIKNGTPMLPPGALTEEAHDIKTSEFNLRDLAKRFSFAFPQVETYMQQMMERAVRQTVVDSRGKVQGVIVDESHQVPTCTCGHMLLFHQKHGGPCEKCKCGNLLRTPRKP